MNCDKFNLWLLTVIGGFLLLSSSQLAAQTVCAPAPVGLVSTYAAENNAITALPTNAPNADYQFQNSRDNSAPTVAPALTDLGAGNLFQTDTVDNNSQTVLRFPQGNGLQLQPTTGVVANDAYAVVAQFRFDNVQGYRRILDFKNGTSDGGLYVLDRRLVFYPQALGGTNAPIAANTFVQVGLTRTAAGTVTGYVNGVKQFSFDDSMTQSAVIDSNNTLRFFQDNTSGGATGEHSAGAVARIRLYNYTLTGAENTTFDSRSRNNGTLQGNVTYTAGKVGQAVQLGGNGDLNNNGDRILVGNPANLQLQNFTIEAWIKRSSASVVTNSPFSGNAGGTFFAFGQNGYGFLIDQNTGRLALTNVGNSAVFSTATINDTNFHHVAVAKSGNQIAFYVDGAADAPVTYDTTFAFTTNAAIGARGDQNAQNAFFGIVDELSIYNRGLATAEIQAIYNSQTTGKCKPVATVAPDNQVLWLAGDGNARDSSGNGNNAALQNGANFGIGKVGQSFALDGVSSYVSVPDSPALNFGTGGFSVEGWFSFNTIAGEQVLIEKYVETLNASSSGFTFTKLSNNTFRLAFAGGTFVDSTPQTITDNVSYHAAATRSASGAISIYLNGTLIAAGTNSANVNSTAALKIGHRGNPTDTPGSNDANGLYLNGRADEVSAYNRALTADEVTSIYNAGLAGKYKAAATNAGANAQTKVGDVTVTFANATSAGTTPQTPLDRSKLPALPTVPTRYFGTSLNYDIAATAAFTGSIDECFNLPSFTVQSDFNNLRVLHLENGGWIDRTLSNDFATKTLCARTASLSPFAVVGLNQPTAADVTISGRVLNAKGRALIRARVTLTDASGNLQAALTDKFGRYRFENVPAAALYTLKARAVGHSFEQNNKTLFVNGDTTDVDFVAAQ